MSWAIESISVQKESDFEGEASVRLVDDEDSRAVLFINKLIIDLHSGTNCVSIVKFQGTPVLGGQVIEDIKGIVLEVFQDLLSDQLPGLYEVNSSGEIEKLV